MHVLSSTPGQHGMIYTELATVLNINLCWSLIVDTVLVNLMETVMFIRFLDCDEFI